MTELVIQPSTHDAHVKLDSPGSNYGTVTTIRVEQDDAADWRVFIEFDLSSIPSYAVVDAASLFLYVDSKQDQDTGTDQPVDVQRADASWDESTITWTNQPGVTGSVMATLKESEHPAAGNWAQFDLKVGEVELMRATNNGMRLKVRYESINPTLVDFISYRSSEHATTTTRPKLAVSYTLPSTGLVTYFVDIWDPHRRVYNAQGHQVAPEEIRPNAWWELQGLELPSGVVYDSMVDDPSKFYGAGVEYDVQGVRVIGDRSDFADLIIRRAAGGV